MRDFYNEKDDVGYGGFFLNNIRKWIIKECLESGDPESFFDNLLVVIEDLEGSLDLGIGNEYWEKLEEEVYGN